MQDNKQSYEDNKDYAAIDATEGVFGEESSTPVVSNQFSFTTGPAGSGKTFGMKRLIEEDEQSMLLCATTGVAAVNLDSVTLNSVLKYFDTESLADAYTSGRLTRTLMALYKNYRSLGIDEISMMDGDQLDLITEAAIQAADRGAPIGIHLTGDFAQLPPVKAKWAFEAYHWSQYEANMTKLTKIWRQTNPDFLNAINFARAGKGEEAAEGFRNLKGLKWAVGVDNKFDGTTIMSKNEDVDRYNRMRYMALKGSEKAYRGYKSGKKRAEWDNIPDILRLKEGALVMILANKMWDGELIYANGDLGHIVYMGSNHVTVLLNRTCREVNVEYIVRKNATKDQPRDAEIQQWSAYYDEPSETWVLGNVTYMPLRLAYSATVHKTQGLTLDNIQIDMRGGFFGAPGMMYVALSRARTPQGLRLVGSAELMAKRIKVEPKIEGWI